MTEKQKLDHATAMKIAKRSFADTSAPTSGDAKTPPIPAPYITMTAGNLVRFFQLASKEYEP